MTQPSTAANPVSKITRVGKTDAVIRTVRNERFFIGCGNLEDRIRFYRRGEMEKVCL